jgi:hypothetical protein
MCGLEMLPRLILLIKIRDRGANGVIDTIFYTGPIEDDKEISFIVPAAIVIFLGFYRYSVNRRYQATQRAQIVFVGNMNFLIIYISINKS